VANVEALAEKLLTGIASPYRIAENTVHTACSIGISLYPRNATDAESLMRLADGAMHTAKQTGRGRYVFSASEAALLEHEQQRTITSADGY
jgi:cyclic di-GMP phosphodiesterase Gmr